jgi:hypothetical protein
MVSSVHMVIVQHTMYLQELLDSSYHQRLVWQNDNDPLPRVSGTTTNAESFCSAQTLA